MSEDEVDGFTDGSGAVEEPWRDGGEPACWLEQVCEHCGTLTDRVVAPASAGRCPTCGRAR